MARNTDESLTRALGRRAAQVVLVGAMAATPLALGTGMASATDWDELAQCESGGNWNTNTGNGFGGGLQFTDSTWHAFGGSGQPENASREQQIAVAERVKAAQGMDAWPTCSRKTGNTDGSPDTRSAAASPSSNSGSSHVGGVAATPPAQPSQPAQPAQPAAPGAAYTVADGDTLSSIAAAHGVSWQSIAQRNALPDPNALTPGQQLAVR